MVRGTQATEYRNKEIFIDVINRRRNQCLNKWINDSKVNFIKGQHLQ